MTNGAVVGNGEFIGTMNLGTEKPMLYLTWGKQVPDGSGATIRYRTAGSDFVWSSWSDPPTSALTVVINTTAQYFGYELTLTSDGTAKPQVDDVTLHFRDPNPGDTPTGDNVTVSLPTNVNVTIDQVTDPGFTEITVPPPVQNPPGYRTIRILDLITSARFNGTITLDIGFDKTVIQDPNSLQLFHWNSSDGVWEDITALVDIDNAKVRGVTTTFSPFLIAEYDGVTGIGEESPVVPSQIMVRSYPNPFNPSVTITFSLLKASEVSVSIYDTAGRKVENLYSGLGTKGENQLTWDGLNESGNHASTGVYFCQVKTAESVGTAKLVLLK